MKRLRIILLLLIATPALAMEPIDFSKPLARMGVMQLSGGVAAAPSGHCDDGTHDGDGNAINLCEDFDGSTNCTGSAEPYCRQAFEWVYGAAEFNSTTPAIEGSRSAKIVDEQVMREAFGSAVNNRYSYFLFQWHISKQRPIHYYNASGTAQCIVFVDYSANAGKIRARALGGTTVTSVSAMSANTTYSIWTGYEVGTGANAKCFACFSASPGTKPERTDNACANSTDGTGTTQHDQVVFGSLWGSGNTVSFDHIRVNTTEIGTSPP